MTKLNQTDIQRIQDWRDELGIPKPSTITYIDGNGAQCTKEVDGLTDTQMYRLLANTEGMFKPNPSIMRECQSLQIRRPGTSIALDDMLASEAGSFHISGTINDPNTNFDAPKNWDKWKRRARVALHENSTKRDADWERYTLPFTLDETHHHDFIDMSDEFQLDELDNEEYDESLGADIDDRRWEDPNYVLDPYWSTCPAVIRDKQELNDDVRFIECDGAQQILRNDYDHLESLKAAGRQAWASAKNAETPFKQQWRNMLVKGYLEAVDNEKLRRAESLTREVITSNERTTTKNACASETAWRNHGTHEREARFRRVMAVINRCAIILQLRAEMGQNSPSSALAGPALAFIRLGLNRIEEINREGMNARKRAIKTGDITIASGRDYTMARKHMVFIRHIRNQLLNKYQTIRITKNDIRQMSLLYTGITKITRTPPLLGARSKTAFDTKDNNHTKQLMTDLGVVSQFGLCRKPKIPYQTPSAGMILYLRAQLRTTPTKPPTQPSTPKQSRPYIATAYGQFPVTYAPSVHVRRR